MLMCGREGKERKEGRLQPVGRTETYFFSLVSIWP